jgi:hypothetical protein
LSVDLNDANADATPMPLFRVDDPGRRVLQYMHAAETLNLTCTATTRVAVSEPGAFGYTFLGETIGLDGLVYPPVLRYYPVPEHLRSDTSPYSIPPAAIREVRPDYVVFYDAFARNGILQDEYFKSEYRQVGFVPLEVWLSTGLFVYERKDRSK